MAHFHIRPINLPADYEAVARLLTFVRPDAVSAASLCERDQKKPTANDVSYDDAGRLTGYFRVRLVATSADGRQVIGYAEASREYGNLPGDMVESVLVDPEHRHQGIGAALYEQLHAFTLEQRPAVIYSLYPDEDMAYQSFAEKRGYCIERHYFTSRLDLTSFDESRFSDVIASVQASGIHFLTLDQWRAMSDDKSLYEYVLLAFQDVPGTLQPPSFSTWLDGLNASPENFTIIARDGAQFVGLT
ncbi:MAG: N-acetyltransferase family protein, partial [Tumebacillaceae bacterium]